MNALALAITRREIKETLTDWRILVPILSLAFLFPLILVGSMNVGLPYMKQVDPILAQEKAVLFGATMAAFFPISFSLIIALESFSGEKERNTLEALLATPISDGEMFLGKFLAVLLPPAALSIVGLTVFTLGARVALEAVIPLDFLALAQLLSFVEALAMVSAAVVISSQTASVKAANLLASFIIIPVALVVQTEVMLLLLGYGEILWFIFAEFILVSLVLMRMGIRLFNREEILTRENDDLNLLAVLRKAARFWVRLPNVATGDDPCAPFHPLRLFGKDIPQILGAYRGPLVIVVGALIVGAAVGYIFAYQHPLPIPMESWRPMVERGPLLQQQMETISFSGIFFHNLRILSVAAFLSIVSFGVAGLLVVVVTGGAVGFVVGQIALMNVDVPTFLFAFVLPHGLLEIPALILIGAMNLQLGMCLMTLPKGYSLGDGLLLALVNWGKAATVFVPLLLLAAFVEVKITPLVVLAIYGA